MKKKLKNIVLIFLFVCIGCKEEFTPETNDFESRLVVEATITDKLETQSLKLSRTTILEDRGILIENNANVIVETDKGTQYQFHQEEDGVYYSDIKFSAKPDIMYTLHIKTTEDKIYRSNNVKLPQQATLNKVYAKRITKEEEDGIQVYVESQGKEGVAGYFRYEYQETYEIVTERYSVYETSLKNIKDGGASYDVVVNLKEDNTDKVCYSSNFSKGVNQTSTSSLSENLATDFPIRFIPADDPIIRNLYSIKVTQYTESPEAYSFNKILKDLADSEDVFSQNQPGAIQGNIYNTDDDKDLVVGYFEIALKESKRIFFDHSDFNIPTPPYYYDCETVTYDYTDDLPAVIDGDLNERKALYEAIAHNGYTVIPNQTESNLVYKIIPIECADCTSFSSNTKPEFWIE